MGHDTKVPRGTRPQWWLVFTSRHKGLLPASTQSEATATVSGAGERRALSLGQAAQVPLCCHSGDPEVTTTAQPCSEPLGWACWPWSSYVNPSQASSFTGEGLGSVRVMLEGQGLPGGSPEDNSPAKVGQQDAPAGRVRDGSFSGILSVTTKEVLEECFRIS